MDEISNYIKQSQSISGMLRFKDWLESVAKWLETAFPNAGYTAEWLALDPGPPEGDRSGDLGQFKIQLEEAVDGRIQWLNKLDKVMRPVATVAYQIPLTDSSAIMHQGLLLFKAESAMQADETLTTWIESVHRWLVENSVESASLVTWNTMRKSPFRLPDGVWDTPRTWEQYWNIVSKRFRWLADFISRSATIDSLYRQLTEIEATEIRVKINFDGPGYELIAMLREAFEKDGGHTKYRLFGEDEDIYEYASFKFTVRGKDMTVRQLKKSVENQKYL